MLIVRQQPFSIPQNDRIRLANKWDTRARLLIEQASLCLDLNDDSFINDLASLT